MEWPRSTNRGTALLKLLHQYDEDVIVKDDYIGWFLGDEIVQNAEATLKSLEDDDNPESQFQRIAYWYGILREKYFDDLIENAIRQGYQQLLLLGAGFDTRFLRLSVLRNGHIPTTEIDTPATIQAKREVLESRLGGIPKDLHLLPMDFTTDKIDSAFQKGLRNNKKTICVWQGVSYYLPKKTVSTVLDFVFSAFSSETLIGFDGCTPLMLTTNDRIPGIKFNIDRLNKIDEPYVFGMYEQEMERWLMEKGFRDITILDQTQLEKQYLRSSGLPKHMWYVASARSPGNSAAGK